MAYSHLKSRLAGMFLGASRVGCGLVLLWLSGASGVALGAGPDTLATAAAPSARPTPFAQLVHDSVTPLLTRRTLVIVSSGAVLAAVATTFEDPEAAARALDDTPWQQLGDVGNFYGEATVLSVGAAGLWSAGAWSGDANTRDAGFDALRSLGITYAAVAILKVSTQRTRPDGDAYSFPSGHTAGAFAVAPVLAQHYGRRVGIPAYLLGVMTGIGRIKERRHYLSDVVFGAALGTAVGLAESQPVPTTRLSVVVMPGRVGIQARF